MSRFGRCALAGMISCMTMLSGAQPAQAQGARITMTGIVPTRCEASFSKAPVATGERVVDLGLMTRRCNDGAGYRVILHLQHAHSGGMVVMGSRRIPLSTTGETVLIDSSEDERASEPAYIDFEQPVAPGTVELRLQTVPKGEIY